MTFPHPQRDEIIALYKTGQSRAAISKMLGLTKDCVQKVLQRAAIKGDLGTKHVLPGFGIDKISEHLDASGAVKGTHVRQRVKGPMHEPPPGLPLKGVSSYVDSEGRVIGEWRLYREKMQEHETLVKALETRFANAALERPLLTAEPVLSTDQDFLSVYPIADQHLGLLAWGRETGEDYDLKIGSDRLRAAAKRLVEQTPASATAILLNLGDWQHNDDGRNKTPEHGFNLDVDSRYMKIAMAGVDLMVDVIELALQRHQTIIVRNLPGNHDPHAYVALTVGLKAHYRNHPRVTIDASPAPCFYYRFGNVFLGATHGHRMKPQDMFNDMAVTHRSDWAAADFRYFYFGHIHHKTAQEVGDVICESFRTIASNDAFHAAGGYNAGRTLTSITHHIEEGEDCRRYVNIKPPRR